MERRLGMFKTIFSYDLFQRVLERCVIALFYSSLTNPSLTLPKDKGGKESWPETAGSLSAGALSVLMFYRLTNQSKEMFATTIGSMYSRVRNCAILPKFRAVKNDS